MGIYYFFPLLFLLSHIVVVRFNKNDNLVSNQFYLSLKMATRHNINTFYGHWFNKAEEIKELHQQYRIGVFAA